MKMKNKMFVFVILACIVVFFAGRYYLSTLKQNIVAQDNTKEMITEMEAAYSNYNDMENKPFSFDDYKVDVSENNTGTENREIFYDRIFAGHYKTSLYKNGTIVFLSLIDEITKKEIGPILTFNLHSDLFFKGNSKLFVVKMYNYGNGITNELDDEFIYTYYTFEQNNKLKFLGTFVYRNNTFIKVEDINDSLTL